MSRVSISDVANLVGVSETTVSHALSGRRPVSAETVARVQEASKQLGYRPSRVARSLRGQRTHTTALVIPDICNPFYPALARGLQDLLSARGYQTFVCDTDGREDLETMFLMDAIDRQVDGIVIAPILGGFPASLLASSEIPVVVVSSAPAAAEDAFRNANVDIVSGHDELGMKMAAEYLLGKGHTRIGLINAPLSIGPAERRFEGFKSAMAAAGVAVSMDLVATTSFTREGGAQGLAQLLAAPHPPTAVLCANDLIAIGAMDIAHGRGISIPDDLAVIGYDDIDAAGLVSPALTTVVNPARELGQACGRLLLDRMTAQYSGNSREVRIAHNLVIRESA